MGPRTGFLTATEQQAAQFRVALRKRGCNNHVFYVKSPSAGYRLSRLVVTFSLDPQQTTYAWSPLEVRTLQHIVDAHWRPKVYPARDPIYRPTNTFEELIEEFCVREGKANFAEVYDQNALRRKQYED